MHHWVSEHAQAERKYSCARQHSVRSDVQPLHLGVLSDIGRLEQHNHVSHVTQRQDAAGKLCEHHVFALDEELSDAMELLPTSSNVLLVASDSIEPGVRATEREAGACHVKCDTHTPCLRVAVTLSGERRAIEPLSTGNHDSNRLSWLV